MAEQIFEEFGPRFDVLLIPGSQGIFDVTVDGRRIYSKHETGRHATYEEVAAELRQLGG
jgi:selenoprotein W-related protein